ncbi:MAG: class I SAM-dependent methyltransferase [Candidatus Methanoperedens sp.]|nr:class I SAM-dependent methyltransferase [Candidatus Methanoperedens sp.]
MEIEMYSQIEKLQDSNWWYKAKKDLIKRTVERLDKKGQILDIGCGTGSNIIALEKCGSVLGIDISKEAIKYAKSKNKNLVIADAHKIPFKKGSITIALSLDVMEHLEKDSDFLEEVNSILGKNGYIIVFVPAFKFLWNDNDVWSHHKKRYSKKELNDLLNSHGFEIVLSSYWNLLSFLPNFIIATLQKLNRNTRKEVKNNLIGIPSALNEILYRLLLLENFIILSGYEIPIGVSALTIARAKKS